MRISPILRPALCGWLAIILLGACGRDEPQPAAVEAAIAMDADDIAGFVQSTAGPEAGVWVIAETDDFDTRFARIVVTDDEGRYLVPDLPDANYQLWVRGYGLKDSAKVAASPGDSIDLSAIVAPDAATAAQVYPAAYWYSMLGLPTEEEVADIPGGLNNYLMWTKNMGCVGCHQMGQKSTRTLPEGYGDAETSQQAWARRIASGQAGNSMVGIAVYFWIFRFSLRQNLK